MKKDENGNFKVKVIFLGGYGSGKTSIISRYLEGTYDIDSLPTVSATYGCKTIEINDKPIILEIWDTCGSPIFRSLNKFYIKDADVIVLVYNITRDDDFKDLQIYLEYEIRDEIPRNASKKKIFFYII